MKNRSKDAVDGAVSLAMAFYIYLKLNLDEEKGNLEAYLNFNEK